MHQCRVRDILILFGLLAAVVFGAGTPLFAQEGGGEEAAPEQGVAELDFLKDAEEGNLAVDPAAIKPDAWANYTRALALFKSYARGRSFWGRTKTGAAGHDHDVMMDGAGNGTTGPAPDGHVHEIKGAIVKETAGHSHDLLSIDSDPTQGLAKFGLAKDPKYAVSIDAKYFFHALCVTEPGADGHTHTAVTYYRSAFQALSSRSAEHFHILHKLKMNKAVKAIQGNKAIAHSDPHEHALRWVAVQYFSADSLTFLTGLFQEAARKHQGFAQANYYACICQQWMQEYADALKNADISLRAKTDFQEAFCERGDIQMWLGEFEKARADFKRAMQIRPEDPKPHFSDAMCCLRMAAFDQAAASFATTIEKARVDVRKRLELIVQKSKELLDEPKRNALAAFIEYVFDGDIKELGKAHKAATDVLKDKDQAWVDKVASIAGELLQARQWASDLKAEEGWPGWKGYTESSGENYTVRAQQGEMSQALVDYFGGQLESAYKLYRSRFSRQVENKVPTKVYVYATQQSYVKDGAPPQSGGYQHPYFNKIVFPISPRDYAEKGFTLGGTPSSDNLINTGLVLFHEAFHKFLNKFMQMAPQCFNEGCADYFGASRFSATKVSGGWKCDLTIRVNPWRLKGIQDMIKQDIHLPFECFWKMTKGEMYNGRYQGMNYAQAWAWVFFLFERTDAAEWKEMQDHQRGKRKYFEVLGKFYTALSRGEGLNGAWDESFGKLGPAKLAALEAEWKEFVLKLKE